MKSIKAELPNILFQPHYDDVSGADLSSSDLSIIQKFSTLAVKPTLNNHWPFSRPHSPNPSLTFQPAAPTFPDEHDTPRPTGSQRDLPDDPISTSFANERSTTEDEQETRFPSPPPIRPKWRSSSIVGHHPYPLDLCFPVGRDNVDSPETNRDGEHLPSEERDSEPSPNGESPPPNSAFEEQSGYSCLPSSSNPFRHYGMRQNFASLTINTINTSASSSPYSSSPLPPLSSTPPASTTHGPQPGSYNNNPSGTWHDLFSTSVPKNESSMRRQYNMPDTRGSFSSDRRPPASPPPAAYRSQPLESLRTKTGPPLEDSKCGPTKPSPLTTFLSMLHQKVSDPKQSHFIKWTELGNSFVVTSRSVFGTKLKGSNFPSFVRQLNMYRFHKVNRATKRNPRACRELQIWEFSHPKFVRYRPNLIKEIKGNGLSSKSVGTAPNTTCTPSSKPPLTVGDFAGTMGLTSVEEKMQRLGYQSCDAARLLRQEMEKSKRLEERYDALTQALVGHKEQCTSLNRMITCMWKFLEQDSRFSESLPGPIQNGALRNPLSTSSVPGPLFKDLVDSGAGLGPSTEAKGNEPPTRVSQHNPARESSFPSPLSTKGITIPSPQSIPPPTRPLADQLGGHHNGPLLGGDPLFSLSNSQLLHLLNSLQVNPRRGHPPSSPGSPCPSSSYLLSPSISLPDYHYPTPSYAQALRLHRDGWGGNQVIDIDDGPKYEAACVAKLDANFSRGFSVKSGLKRGLES